MGDCKKDKKQSCETEKKEVCETEKKRDLQAQGLLLQVVSSRSEAMVS